MKAETSHIRLTVDAIVFGYSRSRGLQVLLIRRKYEPFKDVWALPGGFVLKEESLENAVMRELEEESGIRVSYLEQLYTFGKPDRDPRQRVVSVAYFALVKSSQYEALTASTDADDAKWFDAAKLPKLAFDHKEIINLATERLRTKIRYQPIGFELLDKTFAFSDLEHLYATISGKEIDRRNFAKKIKAMGVLEESAQPSRVSGKGRPGKMYQFNKKVTINF